MKIGVHNTEMLAFSDCSCAQTDETALLSVLEGIRTTTDTLIRTYSMRLASGETSVSKTLRWQRRARSSRRAAYAALRNTVDSIRKLKETMASERQT